MIRSSFNMALRKQRHFYLFAKRDRFLSARENHPTWAVEMTPFASKNGNLFGCVSKTSCCEYLVEDTRSEKMTQLSQAPLTALFVVVSLSILYRKHFCVFVF